VAMRTFVRASSRGPRGARRAGLIAPLATAGASVDQREASLSRRSRFDGARDASKYVSAIPIDGGVARIPPPLGYYGGEKERGLGGGRIFPGWPGGASARRVEEESPEESRSRTLQKRLNVARVHVRPPCPEGDSPRFASPSPDYVRCFPEIRETTLLAKSRVRSATRFSRWKLLVVIGGINIGINYALSFASRQRSIRESRSLRYRIRIVHDDPDSNGRPLKSMRAGKRWSIARRK